MGTPARHLAGIVTGRSARLTPRFSCDRAPERISKTQFGRAKLLLSLALMDSWLGGSLALPFLKLPLVDHLPIRCQTANILPFLDAVA